MGAYNDKKLTRTADVISLYQVASIPNDNVEKTKEIKTLSTESLALKTSKIKLVYALNILSFSAPTANNKLTVQIKKNGVFVTKADYTDVGFFENMVAYGEAGDNFTFIYSLQNDNTGGTGLPNTVSLDHRAVIVTDSGESCSC